MDRKLVEYLTGRIPLLLRILIDSETFDYDRLLRHEDIRKVKDDIIEFFREKKYDLNETNTKM